MYTKVVKKFFLKKQTPPKIITTIVLMLTDKKIDCVAIKSKVMVFLGLSKKTKKIY